MTKSTKSIFKTATMAHLVMALSAISRALSELARSQRPY